MMTFLCCTKVSADFLGGSGVKKLPVMQEMCIPSLGWEDPLEKEAANHSRIFAWRIPRREEPGGPQSMGSQRVGHSQVTVVVIQPVRALSHNFIFLRTVWAC